MDSKSTFFDSLSVLFEVSKLRGKASDSSKRMKGVPTAGIEGRPESPSSSPEAWYNIPKPSEEGLEILGFPS